MQYFGVITFQKTGTISKRKESKSKVVMLPNDSAVYCTTNPKGKNQQTSPQDSSVLERAVA